MSEDHITFRIFQDADTNHDKNHANVGCLFFFLPVLMQDSFFEM